MLPPVGGGTVPNSGQTKHRKSSSPMSALGMMTSRLRVQPRRAEGSATVGATASVAAAPPASASGS